MLRCLGCGLWEMAHRLLFPVIRICSLPSQMVPAHAPAPFRFRACLQGLFRPTRVVPTMSKMPNSVPKSSGVERVHLFLDLTVFF